MSQATISDSPPLDSALQAKLASNLQLCRQGALAANPSPSHRCGSRSRPSSHPLLPSARTIWLPWPARHSQSHNATFRHPLLLPRGSRSPPKKINHILCVCILSPLGFRPPGFAAPPPSTDHRNIVTSFNSFQLQHHTPHHNGWTHFISASNSTSPYNMHALFQSAVPLLVPFSCCPASCATACATWAHRLKSNMCSPMARLLQALLHAASADTFQTLSSPNPIQLQSVVISLAHQSDNLQWFHLGIHTSAAFLRFTPCITPDTIPSQVVIPLSTLCLLPAWHASHMWTAFPRLYQPGLRFFSRPLFLFLQLTTVCSTCFATAFKQPPKPCHTVCPPHLRLQLGYTRSFSLFSGKDLQWNAHGT